MALSTDTYFEGLVLMTLPILQDAVAALDNLLAITRFLRTIHPYKKQTLLQYKSIAIL